MTRLAATVQGMVYRYGRAWTLRKAATAAGANDWTRGAETVTYSQCQARARDFTPEEIRGGLVEGDEILVVSVSSLGGVVPAKGDRIAPGLITIDASGQWRQIVNVDRPEIGVAAAAYRLQLRK